MPEWAEACLKTYPLGWKGFGLSMCLLIAGNETVLEVGWEGRGSPPRAPGRPRPACHPGHLSEGPLQGQRSTCLSPQGCREERLQQETASLWTTLQGSGQDRVGGQPAPQLSPRSLPLPTAGLWKGQLGLPARYPASPPALLIYPHSQAWLLTPVPSVGKAGKGVIRSCPPLQLNPPHSPQPRPSPRLPLLPAKW